MRIISVLGYFVFEKKFVANVLFYHYKLKCHARKYMLIRVVEWRLGYSSGISDIEERRLKTSHPVITPS